jgi:serine/threonine-protein kinase
VELTALDRTRNENTHRWPESLPGGRRVIFTARRGGDMEDADLEAVDLDTGKRHLLIKGGSFGQYVPSGHLVYGRQTELLAVAFDASTLHVRSSPSRVVDGVITGAGTGSVDFSVSATGSLAYVPKAVGADERRLVSVDEKGQAEDLVAARGAYDAPRLSPDGRQVAVTVGEGSGSNVWTYDLQRGTARRATRGLRDGWSVWDPDGRHLTISANIAAARNIVAWDLEAEQSGPPLAPSAQWQWPTSWSPDGRSLAYTEYNPSSLADVWILEGDQRRPFVATAGMDTGARFSPDGRWLAYASDETGAPQVCIKPFPGPGPALQVSEGGGGDQPVWDRSAPRLYFRHGEKLFLVEMAGSPARPSKPRLVFEGAYRGAFFNHAAGYDVLPGGHRFVMIKDSERAMPKTEINLVVNWSDELARRVLPTDP